MEDLAGDSVRVAAELDDPGDVGPVGGEDPLHHLEPQIDAGITDAPRDGPVVDLLAQARGRQRTGSRPRVNELGHRATSRAFPPAGQRQDPPLDHSSGQLPAPFVHQRSFTPGDTLAQRGPT